MHQLLSLKFPGLLISIACLLSACSKEDTSSTTGNPSQPSNANAQVIPSSFYNSTDPNTHIIIGLNRSSLFVDRSGNKWICMGGSTSGVIKFNGTTWERFTPSNTPIAFKQVTSVYCEDNEGGVYFTTEDANEYTRLLLRYRNGLWSSWNIKDVVTASKIFFNAVDNHLYFYSGHTIKKIPATADFTVRTNYTTITSSGIPYSNFMDCVRSSNNFYIAGENKSLRQPLSGSLELLTPTALGSFRQLEASKTGEVFASATSSKILRLNGANWELLPTNLSSLNSEIWRFAVDHRNHIYINDFRGVGKIVNGELQYYKINNEQIITASPIVIDESNTKWVVVQSGLIKITD
jgi:hypothetical protein